MDKVFIENLEIETIIGIFGWEREVKQIVRISLEMSFDISKAGKSDKIDDALDYKKIGKSIVNLVENSSFFLVEKMAEDIASLVLTALSRRSLFRVFKFLFLFKFALFFPPE